MDKIAQQPLEIGLPILIKALIGPYPKEANNGGEHRMVVVSPTEVSKMGLLFIQGYLGRIVSI